MQAALPLSPTKGPSRLPSLDYYSLTLNNIYDVWSPVLTYNFIKKEKNVANLKWRSIAMTDDVVERRARGDAVRNGCIVCTIVISESFLATVLFPFIYQMVGSFHGVSKSRIGLWAGLISNSLAYSILEAEANFDLASTYFATQTLTAFFWGRCSDRFGRKPILVLGLFGGTAGIIVLGFSRSLAWAITARAICGLFNGNAGVTRTALGELASNSRWDQGKTFSLFGLCSAIGYTFGPLLGGYMANPADRFTVLDPLDRFLRSFPYLLPCFAVACYNIVVVALSMTLLSETRSRDRFPEGGTVCTPKKQASTDVSGETEPLLDSHGEEMTAPNTKSTRMSSRSISLCVLILGLLAFHSIVFDEIYPIFASTPPPSGLGFTPSEIGLTLSVMGPIVLVAALSVFPYLNAHYSTLRVLQVTAIIYILTYILFSLLPDLSFHGKTSASISQRAALFLLMGIRFATNVIAYTSAGVLLNAIARPESRGAIMG
ncbi:MAG: hypothetical protein Q9222_002707 [Ikaeria aurantiellina]